MNAKHILAQAFDGGIELSLSTAGDKDFRSFAQKALGSGKAKTGRTAGESSSAFNQIQIHVATPSNRRKGRKLIY